MNSKFKDTSDAINHPQLSIITVVFNASDYVESTIQSVINQSYKKIEYIIVDGGSTDGTLEKINKYRKYIDHLVSEPDCGIYDAMNKGIRQASGRYVNFLNAGDTLLNSSVCSKLIEKYIKNEPNDYVYLLRVVKDNGVLIRAIFPSIIRYYKLPTYHQGIIYPISELKRLSFSLNYDLASDFHHYFVLTKKVSVINVPLVWCKYDTSGVSSTNKKQLHGEFAAIYKELGISKFLYYFRKLRSLIGI